MFDQVQICYLDDNTYPEDEHVLQSRVWSDQIIALHENQHHAGSDSFYRNIGLELYEYSIDIRNCITWHYDECDSYYLIENCILFI